MQSHLIQWTEGAKYWDKAYNPVVGCIWTSEGCDNCYASDLCRRFKMNGDNWFLPTGKPTARPPKKGVVFVGNMTDLFGSWNTQDEISTWLNSLSAKATNLVLTKRSGRLYKFMDLLNGSDHILAGATAENQARLEERLGDLFCLRRRWLSLEPLLGKIDFREAMAVNNDIGDDFTDAVDWVVVGAESGPNRRPCKLTWVERVVGQCLHYKIPVFVKQLDLNGKLEKDINKFPEHLRIRQLPWIEKRRA